MNVPTLRESVSVVQQSHALVFTPSLSRTERASEQAASEQVSDTGNACLPGARRRGLAHSLLCRPIGRWFVRRALISTTTTTTTTTNLAKAIVGFRILTSSILEYCMFVPCTGMYRYYKVYQRVRTKIPILFHRLDPVSESREEMW